MKRSFISAFAAIATSCNKYQQASIVVQELKLACSDGTILSAQCFQRQTKTATTSISSATTKDSERIILCLHGWLDNCRSFHHLGPTLASSLEKNTKVITLDFPGHGKSSHRSLDSSPLVQADMVYYVCEAIEAISNKNSHESVVDEIMADTIIKSAPEEINKEKDLSRTEKKISLIGHSLGAGVACLSAAAFPELIDKLVLLDGSGFLARKAEDTALHVRNHVVTRRRQGEKQKQKPRLYPSLEMAIRARRQSTNRMPGNQTLSYEAAKELVQRGTHPCRDGQVQFQHDSRYDRNAFRLQYTLFCFL